MLVERLYLLCIVPKKMLLFPYLTLLIRCLYNRDRIFFATACTEPKLQIQFHLVRVFEWPILPKVIVQTSSGSINLVLYMSLSDILPSKKEPCVYSCSR